MRARPQEQAKSYKDREFRVWLPQGLKQVFIYDPVSLLFVFATERPQEKLLSDVLADTKKANKIDEAAAYNCFHHGTGELIESTNVCHSKLKSSTLSGRSLDTQHFGDLLLSSWPQPTN